MPRDILVSQVMTSNVIAFSPDEPIQDAMGRLVEGNVDGGPVVDSAGKVVGMLTAGDLIVQDARLHYPTVITILGATLELPGSQRHFEDELHKAVGVTVGEVMSDDVVTCRSGDTVEDAATVMHERHLSRLPVVDGGRLVGIIARGDILRAIVQARAQG
jgi:CBS domain-containing protein